MGSEFFFECMPETLYIWVDGVGTKYQQNDNTTCGWLLKFTNVQTFLNLIMLLIIGSIRRKADVCLGMLEAKREKVRWRAWAGVTPSVILYRSESTHIYKMPVFYINLYAMLWIWIRICLDPHWFLWAGSRARTFKFLWGPGIDSKE